MIPAQRLQIKGRQGLARRKPSGERIAAQLVIIEIRHQIPRSGDPLPIDRPVIVQLDLRSRRPKHQIHHLGIGRRCAKGRRQDGLILAAIVGQIQKAGHRQPLAHPRPEGKILDLGFGNVGDRLRLIKRQQLGGVGNSVGVDVQGGAGQAGHRALVKGKIAHLLVAQFCHRQPKKRAEADGVPGAVIVHVDRAIAQVRDQINHLGIGQLAGAGHIKTGPNLRLKHRLVGFPMQNRPKIGRKNPVLFNPKFKVVPQGAGIAATHRRRNVRIGVEITIQIDQVINLSPLLDPKLEKVPQHRRHTRIHHGGNIGVFVPIGLALEQAAKLAVFFPAIADKVGQRVRGSGLGGDRHIRIQIQIILGIKNTRAGDQLLTSGGRFFGDGGHQSCSLLFAMRVRRSCRRPATDNLRTPCRSLGIARRSASFLVPNRWCNPVFQPFSNHPQPCSCAHPRSQ